MKSKGENKMGKKADLELYTKYGVRVVPLYKIGTDIIEAMVIEDGSKRRFSVFELVTKEELNRIKSFQQSLPDIKKKYALRKEDLEKKYNKKLVKKLAIKISIIVQKKVAELKALTPKDIWAVVPELKDFSDLRKSNLKKIARCMQILGKYGINNPMLYADVMNELELRKKSSHEKEKEREKIRALKEKWLKRGDEVLKEIRASKSDAMHHIKRFGNEIYEEHYKGHSLEDCNRLAVKIIEDIEEAEKSKKRKK